MSRNRRVNVAMLNQSCSKQRTHLFTTKKLLVGLAFTVLLVSSGNGLAIAETDTKPSTRTSSNAQPGTQTNFKPNSLIKKAAALDAKLKYPEAIVILTKAIKASPQDPHAYYWRGLSYFHDAQYANAIADLSQAITINNQYQDAHLIRGAAYAESKQYDKAIEEFDWIIKRDPLFKEVLQKKADVYEKMGQDDLSEQIKEKASKMNYRSFIAEGEPSAPPDITLDNHLPKLKLHRKDLPERTIYIETVVTFKSHRDRSISDIKIKKSSNDSIFDQKALEFFRSVKQAGPLPPGSGESLDINLSISSYPELYSVLQLPENLHFNRIHKAKELSNAGKYEKAAKLYKELLDKPKKKYYSPSMAKLEQLVSVYLADCYQSLSHKVRTDPKAQLRYLYPAVYYCPYEDEYQNELADAISQLGKDPKVAADRIVLGDEAHEIGDDIAAIVEYRAALKIKDDPAVRQKLEALEKANDNSKTKEKSPEKKSRS